MTDWVVRLLSHEAGAVRTFSTVVMSIGVGAFAIGMFSLYMIKQGY